MAYSDKSSGSTLWPSAESAESARKSEFKCPEEEVAAAKAPKTCCSKLRCRLDSSARWPRFCCCWRLARNGARLLNWNGERSGKPKKDENNSFKALNLPGAKLDASRWNKRFSMPLLFVLEESSVELWASFSSSGLWGESAEALGCVVFTAGEGDRSFDWKCWF